MSNPKISAASWLTRYHFPITIIIVLLLLIAEGWFLYFNFYRSLTAARTIRALHEQAAVDHVNMPLYRRAMEFYTARQTQNSLNTTTLRNPFNTAPVLPVPRKAQ